MFKPISLSLSVLVSGALFLAACGSGGSSVPTAVPTAGSEFQDALASGAVGPMMVVIPGGTFTMGSLSTEPFSLPNEGPQHLVNVASFSMGKYEVTWDEYMVFVNNPATTVATPANDGFGQGNRPVTNVSWDDAVAYTQWLSAQTGASYRLPSESEWEYANRAGTTTSYWWGADIGINNANCIERIGECGDAFIRTSPVGSFAANAFGLNDTLGNVWEWTTDDWHNDYVGAPTDGTPWKTIGSGTRVLRGGSWDYDSGVVRSAFRGQFLPTDRLNDIGFRVSRAN